MVYVKVVNPHENAKRTLASLTEHALYDVSHHRSQKPLSTRKRQSAVFKNLHSGHLFQNLRFWCPKPPFQESMEG